MKWQSHNCHQFGTLQRFVAHRGSATTLACLRFIVHSYVNRLCPMKFQKSERNKQNAVLTFRLRRVTPPYDFIQIAVPDRVCTFFSQLGVSGEELANSWAILFAFYCLKSGPFHGHIVIKLDKGFMYSMTLQDEGECTN